MSRTDKTRPWWVQLVDAPGVSCKPVHDHRFGPCTLPVRAMPERERRTGCRWTGTAAFYVKRCESHGSAEWNFLARQDRRRDRHRARRALRSSYSTAR
ncbi:hypothetical protein M1L60_10665 [Actinoplanes sp. TRM 88003]|uniref:Uncharacterized protein n=1 Tax=Paractinoplanes aksuensis TaxID=2939490 RepID=A0ABT1DJN6_9ACTN|nr:hypothetical protein [Actinoplanes aksuensis]MCO8271054.1 hypothetical protein [Actinoplanes aksuensis]